MFAIALTSRAAEIHEKVSSLVIPMAARVCPKAPPGAQAQVNTIESYVLWGVVTLFIIGVVVGIGAVVAGRVFGMPHASKAGVVSIIIVFCSVIGYFVLPGMVQSMLGNGCV